MKALSLVNVSLSAGDTEILRDISLDVNTGESVALVGASGSGKSSLMALMSGLDRPDTGEVWMLSENIGKMGEAARAKLRRRSVGFVFQAFHLIPTLNVLQNVALAAKLAGETHIKQKALHVLERVGLHEKTRQYPQTLSGGEQQRVALARAWVSRPALLFADEPTGSLDLASSQKVTDLLFAPDPKTQMTRIIATHDLKLAARCDRQVHIEGGRIAKIEGR